MCERPGRLEFSKYTTWASPRSPALHTSFEFKTERGIMPRNKLYASFLVLGAVAASVVTSVLIGGINSPASAETAAVYTTATIVSSSPEPSAATEVPPIVPDVQTYDEEGNLVDPTYDDLKFAVISMNTVMESLVSQNTGLSTRLYEAETELYDARGDLIASRIVTVLYWALVCYYVYQLFVKNASPTFD